MEALRSPTGLTCCNNKPHILFIALPAPGHIFPCSQFARKLVAAGYQVTCVSSGHVFKNLQHGEVDTVGRDQEPSQAEKDIHFQPLLEETEVPTVRTGALNDWFQKLSDEEMQEKLEDFIQQLSPPPCCFIADMFLGWVQDVADKLEIPRHTFSTMPASTLAFMLMVPVLVEQGKLPLHDNIRQDIISLPGSMSIHVDDMWDSFKQPGHKNFDFTFNSIKRLTESHTIFVNTFEELESLALESMRSDMFQTNAKVPKLVPIGPMVPNWPWEGQVLRDNDNEKSEAEKWLDMQGAHSVLYISFGSLSTIASEEQIRELALALEASPYPFLWVYRPPGLPQVNKTLDSTPPIATQCIPPGFEERTRGRGMLIKGWANQIQILSHKSIRAFLSHCGWNSTLESICAGVPMLAWPLLADQRMNARFIVDTAKVGLRFNPDSDGIIKNNEIKKVMSQMMDTCEEGTSARKNMHELQQLARSAVADGGSSRKNIENNLKEILPVPAKFKCKCTNSTLFP